MNSTRNSNACCCTVASGGSVTLLAFGASESDESTATAALNSFLSFACSVLGVSTAAAGDARRVLEAPARAGTSFRPPTLPRSANLHDRGHPRVSALGERSRSAPRRSLLERGGAGRGGARLHLRALAAHARGPRRSFSSPSSAWVRRCPHSPAPPGPRGQGGGRGGRRWGGMCAAVGRRLCSRAQGDDPAHVALPSSA
jgi:hypothetical protein